MNLPNKLTLFRVVLVPIIVLVYLFPYSSFGISVPVYQALNGQISLVNIVVFVLFAVASYTDHLDGSIARKNNLITTFGKFADPIADKLLVNSIFILLAWSHVISPVIPLIMIARDTVVDAVRFMAAADNKVIAASIWGKLKTVMQMVAIIILLLNNIPFTLFNIPMDQILVWLATGCSLYSGYDYFMKNKDIILETV